LTKNQVLILGASIPCLCLIVFFQNFAPPDFKVDETLSVFVDFRNVTYNLYFDPVKKTAMASTEIDFYMPRLGYPIFDLNNVAATVIVDGVYAPNSAVYTPDQASKVRVVKRVLEPGLHKMLIKHAMETSDVWQYGTNWYDPGFGGVNFYNTKGASQVRVGFSMDDLNGLMLERYLPANLEYDQVPMKFNVTIEGANAFAPQFMTNGSVQKIAFNMWQIVYPASFNCASIFFWMDSGANFRVYTNTLTSINGRQIPVTIFSIPDIEIVDLQPFWIQATKTFRDLEWSFGSWPHSQLVIRATNSWGMEYAGGAESQLSDLDHEMFHSYFSRGVMPMNGNSSWIDEALAEWRDEHYPITPSSLLSSADYRWKITSSIGFTSYWNRRTDQDAYDEGWMFISYLDARIKQINPASDMRGYMRHLVQIKMHKTISTPEFQALLEDYIGVPAGRLDDDFNLIYPW
jgi:hypothetical protein